MASLAPEIPDEMVENELRLYMIMWYLGKCIVWEG